MDDSLDEKLRVVLKEAFLHRRYIVYGFIVISLSVLITGLFIPKFYESSATIIVDEQDIIQPIMQGTAEATDITDRAKNARDLIYSRQMLAKVAETPEWSATLATPLEKERVMAEIKRNITVNTSGDNLITISFKDTDPVRAQHTVDKLVEYFIKDSRLRKSEESSKAFEFVNSQVEAYHKKLVEAEKELKDFRSKNENKNIRVGAEAQVARRITDIRSEIESTKLAISEEEIRKASLQKQLSGEAGLSSSLTREGQYLSQVAELQRELDTLRLSYTDTHPDVIKLKHQIEDMKAAIDKERAREKSTGAAGRSRGDTYVDEGIRLSPLYESLRTQLSQSKTQIATLKARLAENKKLLADEIEMSKGVHEAEATFAELNRDYEVNQQIYNDLLRRRENARVSMNMDISQKGLDMQIYEPAYLPVKPSGLRLIHFAFGGLLAGVIIPFGILAGYLEIDPRIRNKKQIEELYGLPVLASVPHWVDKHELIYSKSESRKLLIFAASAMVLYVSIGVARIKGLI